MALNIAFTCDTIVDENTSDIDCYYQAFHARSNTWNDVRYSEYNQYSFNLGDGDFLTQDGDARDGDLIVLVFWVSDSDSRSGLKDRFCTFNYVLDGSSTIILNPELRPKTTPQCGFGFSDNTPTINIEFHTNDFSSDEFSWTYDGVTHYHKRIVSSQTIFDSVGNQTVKYDFDEGDGLEVTNKHTYLTSDDYEVKQKVTNQYGLSKTCILDLRVRFNTPVPGLDFDYTAPIHTTEDVTINAGIKDIDSRITSIKHKLIVRDRNNNDVLQDIEIDENSIIDFSYNRTIEYLQKHFFTQIIYWNDGFASQTINYNKELPITNWVPVVQINKIDKTAMLKTFTQTSSDLDGSIEGWHWKIYFIPPFSSGDYVEVHDFIGTNGDNWEVEFTVGGQYKVEIEVLDDYGAATLDEIAFEIAADCPPSVLSNINNIKFVFPKQHGFQ